MTQTAIDQLINHISLVLDCSTSMQPHERKVVEVAKREIANLAEKSKDFNQETRISIYSFSDPDNIRCLVYDKDVLRLPDISELYRIGGNTALIDATLKSIQDLQLTPQIYGDHAFFEIVVTDGQENRSRNRSHDLQAKLNHLPENWTMATLVPNQQGVRDASNYGFNKDNIGIWDTTTSTGFDKVGQTIRNATDTFFTNRSRGIRRSTGVFTLDTSGLNRTVVRSNLQRLPSNYYSLLRVPYKTRVDEFCRTNLGRFVLGNAFYQLTKPEEIQEQKEIAVLDRTTHEVYSGPAARQLLGLPNYTVKVTPDRNPTYDIFVQSTAPNRNLMPDTKVLVMR